MRRLDSNLNLDLSRFLKIVFDERSWPLWPFLPLQKLNSDRGFIVSRMLWDSDSPQGLGKEWYVYLQDFDYFERNNGGIRITTREALDKLTFDRFDSPHQIYSSEWRLFRDE